MQLDPSSQNLLTVACHRITSLLHNGKGLGREKTGFKARHAQLEVSRVLHFNANQCKNQINQSQKPSSCVRYIYFLMFPFLHIICIRHIFLAYHCSKLDILTFLVIFASCSKVRGRESNFSQDSLRTRTSQESCYF